MADDDEVDFVPLTHELLCECLSEIKLIVGGGGFAFTRLDCSNKELTNLGNKVEDYKQLQHVVLSNNRLEDIEPVTKLPHVLTLQIDSNAVSSLDCMQEADLPWCQRLDLSANRLTALPCFGALQRLKYLCLKGNEIASLEGFGGHKVLEELEMQENQIVSLAGLGKLTSLKRLLLASNQLTSLEGLDTPSLTYLDLSQNQLASLEHIAGAPRLVSLDLRENQLDAEDSNLPELRRLGVSTRALRSLQLSGNPLADSFGDSTKVEALVCVPLLENIDEEEVTDEDREAAKEREQELIEEALARAKEEEEAARAREQEEAEGEGEGEEDEEDEEPGE